MGRLVEQILSVIMGCVGSLFLAGVVARPLCCRWDFREGACVVVKSKCCCHDLQNGGSFWSRGEERGGWGVQMSGIESTRTLLLQCVEWSLSMMTNGAMRLRSIEREAKQAKKAMWANYVPQNTGQTKLSDTFVGKVVEIASGDTLIIKDVNAGVERRVQLSR